MSANTEATPGIHIDPYERLWMIVSIVMLVVFAGAVTVAGFFMGIQLPSPESQVDPAVVTAPGGQFSDDNVGLYEIAPGEYEAYVRGQVWAWVPAEITVPAGSRVTFYITSRDVVHGYKIIDTNVNIMVLPGQISKISMTLDEPGEYQVICNEYCGTGHAIMAGKIIVTEP